MLTVYGALMPIRVLEEIRFWKMQEREHTVVIRSFAPDLEAPFATLLNEWEFVLERTEMASVRLLETAVRGGLFVSPAQQAEVSRLLSASAVQSEQFIQHLMRMEHESGAIGARPVVKTVLEHIVRESEYFLAVLQAGDPLLTVHTPLQFGPGMRARSELEDAPTAMTPLTSLTSAEPTLISPFAVDLSPQGVAISPFAADFPPDTTTAAPRATIPSSQTAQTFWTGTDTVSAPEIASAPVPKPEDGQERVYLHAASLFSDAETESERVATGEGLWSLSDLSEDSAVPIGGHRLPPLPYAYDSLEPHIDEATMRLHHDRHHHSYVDGLNQAEKRLAAARAAGDYALVKHWERELAFHGAGHNLHTLFWTAMSPKGGGRPGGALAAAITDSFGSFDQFRNHFSEAANQVEGGGWALLVWCPRSRRLEILQAEKHQNWSQQDIVPVLPLDVWEHAYYLQYRNERPKYVAAWWNVVNWPFVAERYAKAKQLRWPAF